jgi:hypothetical protein
MATKIATDLWRDELTLVSESYYKLEIGALELFVFHINSEWQFRHCYLTSDETKGEKKIAWKAVKDLNKNKLELKRFIQSQQSDRLKIRPMLADRNIVAKPHEPIFLPSNQSVTLYISTPVWLGLYVNNNEVPLFQLSTFQLSDTWFGPKPHLGELCYSSQFSGRMNLDSLPRRAGRVITPVKIINNATDNLKLEKLSIPCDYLSIYLTDNSELWTPTLTVTREADSSKTQVKIEPELHPKLEKAELISTARVSDHSGLLIKTINMLFS